MDTYEKFTKVKLDTGNVAFVLFQEKPGSIMVMCSRGSFSTTPSQIAQVLIPGCQYYSGAKVVTITDNCAKCGGNMLAGKETTIINVLPTCFDVRREEVGGGAGPWVCCPLCVEPVDATQSAQFAFERRERNLPTFNQNL